MLRTKFATEIERLKSDVVGLLELIIKQHQDTAKALKEESIEKCHKVVKGDLKVNKIYERILETAIWRIAKQQPVAGDLRHIVGYMSIAKELERVADYARNIANFYIQEQPPSKYTKYITKMSDKTLEMMELTKKIISDEEQWSKAKDIIAMDDVIDQEYDNISRELITVVLENVTEKKIWVYTRIMQQLKYLERTGDHIVNIAETLLLITHGLYFDSGR